jgi:S1-C subfamily serine protease
LHNPRENGIAPGNQRIAMRRTLLFSAFMSAMLAVAAPVAAQEGGRGLADALSDLLRGGEAEQPVRRVPFGQAEMQLSFAPLVSEIAPAVVNVYASQQVVVRSPFAGDPFFEQFFGHRQMPPRVQSSVRIR